MVKFSLKGSSVVITCDLGWPANVNISPQFNFAEEWQARVAYHFLQEGFANMLKNIRMRAYNQGWRDAKSHKVPKKKYFSISTNPHEIGN